MYGVRFLHNHRFPLTVIEFCHRIQGCVSDVPSNVEENATFAFVQVLKELLIILSLKTLESRQPGKSLFLKHISSGTCIIHCRLSPATNVKSLLARCGFHQALELRLNNNRASEKRFTSLSRVPRSPKVATPEQKRKDEYIVKCARASVRSTDFCKWPGV